MYNGAVDSLELSTAIAPPMRRERAGRHYTGKVMIALRYGGYAVRYVVKRSRSSIRPIQLVWIERSSVSGLAVPCE